MVRRLLTTPARSGFNKDRILFSGVKETKTANKKIRIGTCMQEMNRPTSGMEVTIFFCFLEIRKRTRHNQAGGGDEQSELVITSY